MPVRKATLCALIPTEAQYKVPIWNVNGLRNSSTAHYEPGNLMIHCQNHFTKKTQH